MKPIRVITQDFQLLTEIDNYASAIVTRSWQGIGSLELRINKYMKDTQLLQKGVLLILGGSLNKVFIIKHKEIELDENGKASENWLIKAPSLKSVLGQRITLPPTTTAYDNKQGDAETVMHHYVNNNVVNPDVVNRAIPNLILAANQNRGSTLSWQSRFKNLAEELTEQSLACGLGWNITLDLANQKWAFDVKEGRNLTVNQSELPPVIFSPKFDSLKTLNYSDSDLNYRNSAYVAGQGEGTDRRVIDIGNSTGLNRHEVFIDARDVDEETDAEPPVQRPDAEVISDLANRGNRKLAEMIQERYLEGQILTKSPFIYEKDYDLGDIVTVQNKEWGVTMDARITEIKEIYEVDGFQLEATFGNDRPTLLDKIKNGFKRFENELTK